MPSKAPTWKWEQHGGIPSIEARTITLDWQPWKGPLSEGPPATAEVFCREHIQNFADSADSLEGDEQHGFTPTIEYRFVNLVGDSAERFRQCLNLSGLVETFNALSNDKQRDLKMSESDLLNETSSQSVRVLVANESFSTGMYGPFESDGSARDQAGNLIERKLRSALVDRAGDKGSATQSRGSYGEGKRGIFQASRVRSVIAYTCFRSRSYDKAGVTRRALGVTHWGQFEDSANNKMRTGLGLLGAVDKSGNFSRPFENEEADDLISSLGIAGLETRDESAENCEGLGTTLIILDPDFSPEELALSVERNFWPSLLDGRFDISVIDDHGKQVPIRPRQNESLAPFITAYDAAKGVSGSSDARLQRDISIDGEQAGTLGLVVDKSEGGWSWQDREVNKHMVVYVRRGMVIEYYAMTAADNPPFVRAAFVVDEHGSADANLKLTEPPLHNNWSEHARDSDAAAARFARLVHDNVRKRTNEWIRQHLTAPPPRRHEFRMFARKFKVASADEIIKPPPPPPPNKTDPWEIREVSIQRESVSGSGSLRLLAVHTCALKSKWREESMDVRVRLQWRVQEADGDVLESGLVDRDLDDVPKEFTWDGKGYVGTLTKAESQFSWASGAYESWTVAPEIKVEPIIEGED